MCIDAYQFGYIERVAADALSSLRLRDMELLVAIHAHRSVTAAASELGFTQPAASRALRDIEQLLRVHVFERDRARGMSLTAAGELVLARARALLADCRSLAMEIEAWRAGTGGRLRLGIIPFVSGPLIERLLADLVADRVAVAVTEASTTRLVDELALEKLDAVVCRCSTAPLPAGLAQDVLLRQEGCLVVHAQNPLVKMPAIRLAQLDDYAWLLPPRDTPTRAAINDVFAKAKLPPPVATVEASSIKIIHLAVRADPRMLSVVPSDAGHDIQRLGGVRRLPFPVPLHMPPIGLVYAARHRDTPLVRRLRSRLRELVRRRREGGTA
jgi:DNA-binding transcriptional LysR family regulator